ncbi:hypothetical protein [Luteibacter sp.]|jgi:hypothetical protein|uniref:hypothetical protein n=1 Tax=Luteibacter sp. TaxID=1886636 RepID=UPI002F42CC83
MDRKVFMAALLVSLAPTFSDCAPLHREAPQVSVPVTDTMARASGLTSAPATESAPGGDGPAVRQGVRGQQVAAALRERFDDVAQQCLGSATAPGFLCSGVMLRPSRASDLQHAWNPTDAEITAGGMTATFLRRDILFGRLAQEDDHGLVLYPVLGTPAGKLRLQVLCVFPTFARSEERDRPGCGRHPAYWDQTRYCQGQGITTAAGWLAHVSQAPGGDIARYQCSFDIRDSAADTARIFNEVPLIRAALSAEAGGQPPEFIVAPWPRDAVAQVPVEAIFYVSGTGGVAAARRDQEDFFRNSGGMVLPIVQITLPATSGADAGFEFREEDQVPLAPTGAWIADDMEARYRSSVADCGTPTRPAFLCSGVLVRGTAFAPSFHSWLPSPASVSRQGVSFTYLRHDFPVEAIYIPEGFIVYPALDTPEGKEQAVIRCVFPVDGHTAGRSNACNEHPYYPVASKSCQDQSPAITTVSTWLAHFNGAPADPAARSQHQCGFRLVTGTPDSAAIFIEAGKATSLATPVSALTKYNEVVVQPWAQTIGARVPLEAFFYIAGTYGLDPAQKDQKDFEATLGLRVPIIRITLPAKPEQRMFEFDPADQAVPYP